MESFNVPLGGPLPESAYSECVVRGKSDPPKLAADSLAEMEGLEGFVLVAKDEESPSDPPLWAVANISPIDYKNLTAPTMGSEVVVVPYHGPHPRDEFIHRIMFRLYPIWERVPPQYTADWESLESWLRSHHIGVVKDPDRPVEWAEFLSTAVARQPSPYAPAWCPPPMPLGGDSGSSGGPGTLVGLGAGSGAPGAQGAAAFDGRYAWEHGTWAKASWVGRETLPKRPKPPFKGFGGFQGTGADPMGAVKEANKRMEAMM